MTASSAGREGGAGGSTRIVYRPVPTGEEGFAEPNGEVHTTRIAGGATTSRSSGFDPAQVDLEASVVERVSALEEDHHHHSSNPSGSSVTKSKKKQKRRLLDRPETPLPIAQIATLCFMRLTEPICFTLILPFINQMLERNMDGVPRTSIGYYAGIVESTFAVVQMCCVLQWGRLSDRIGRKPVLLTGLVGTALSTCSFGLAQTFPQMIAARCISGAFNGNIGVLKASLAEMTDETNQARAFALIPTCFAVGSIIGPSIGGYLSDPAEGWPAVFDTPFWRKYPYLLPCAAGAVLNVVAILGGMFFLEETLPSKVAKLQAKQQRPVEDPTGEEETSGLLQHRRTFSALEAEDALDAVQQAQQRDDNQTTTSSSSASANVSNAAQRKPYDGVRDERVASPSPASSVESLPFLARQADRSSSRPLKLSSLRRQISDISEMYDGHPPDRVASKHSDPPGGEGNAPPIETAASSASEKPPPIRSLLTKEILSVVSSQMVINLTNMSWIAVTPLFCYTQISDGGVSFSKQDIARLLSTGGILSVIAQLALFPRLSKRFGTLSLYRAVLLALPFVFLCFPLAHFLAAAAAAKRTATGATSDQAGMKTSRILTWSALTAMLAFRTISNMALVCATLLINSAAPSRSALGAINGMSQTAGSASRAIGPFASTSLFAACIGFRNVWARQIVWVVFVGVACFAVWMSWQVSTRAESGVDGSDGDEEADDGDDADEDGGDGEEEELIGQRRGAEQAEDGGGRRGRTNNIRDGSTRI